MKRSDQAAGKPNCHQCVYFFITHEPAHPYGCRSMNFKSSRLPSEAVFASSGMICQLFKPREPKKSA